MPIYIANILGNNPNAFIEYCENIKGLKNVRVLREKIKKNSLIIVDGFPMRIRDDDGINNIGLKGNVQLIVNENIAEYIRLMEKYIDKNSEYEPDEKFYNLDDIKLNSVYDALCDKLCNSIYRNRPANKGKDLIKAKEAFLDLNLKDKVVVCNQILNMLRCDIATTADLRLIGEGIKAGNIAVNKNTLCKGEIVLVNQSVTGIFENKIKL